MSTLTQPTLDEARIDRPGGASNILAVVRLHLVNRYSVFAVPWMIMGGIFVVNVAVWWIIFASVSSEADRADARDGITYSGALFYIFVYMLVLGIQAVAYTFPFALGFSVTRRDFWLGSALTFIALSAVYSAGLTILAAIEVATDGWGLGGTMFASFYFGGADASWIERFGLYFATYLFFYFVGAAIATIYQRWRNNGMLALFGTLGIVLIAGIALVSFTSSWPAVGAWFDTNGPSGVIAWSLAPTVVAAITGYFILRRATPKN
ncbi:hypothetical protein SAMN06295879_1982 [Agreia bicolorata]|uniref:Uncharacterized protein n=1 Tax=Agreia bicolorata TaxID=110935 RepID=A0A1T4XZE0_9MICO|nr:hypothetical protein [Agreia bicolorata]SKA94733.1 hypothetical protein SAMN06295879_1982 [Agreia bicolorata]